MSQESCATFGVLGEVLAAVLSYAKWHSIGYAILHFLCGWIYVGYYLLTYGLPHIPKVQ